MTNATMMDLTRTVEAQGVRVPALGFGTWDLHGEDCVLERVHAHDLFLTAYSPLEQGRVVEDETLREIGSRHGKSPAQVTLRWLLQQDRVAAIPRAHDPDHRRANLESFDFELDADEMRRIFALDEGLRLIDPEFAPDWGR